MQLLPEAVSATVCQWALAMTRSADYYDTNGLNNILDLRNP